MISTVVAIREQDRRYTGMYPGAEQCGQLWRQPAGSPKMVEEAATVYLETIQIRGVRFLPLPKGSNLHSHRWDLPLFHTFSQHFLSAER